MTSYQKQKELIKKLTQDIVTLVDKPDSHEANQISMRWKMQIDFEKAFLYESRKKIAEMIYYGGDTFTPAPTAATSEPLSDSHSG